MNTKKKVILSSLVTLVLCLSLMTGASYALFTSESTVNVAVTSAKVKMTATITDATVESKLDETYAVAKISDDKYSVNLSLMTPGDTANVTVAVNNESNVNVKYRVKATITGDLAPALTAVATIEGADYAVVNEVGTNWVALAKETQLSKPITLSVAFPDRADNNLYQNKTANVAITVEAVQGNTVVGNQHPSVITVDEGDTYLLSYATMPTTIKGAGTVILDGCNIVAGNAAATVAEGTTAPVHALTLDTFTGKVIVRGSNLLKGAKNGNGIYVSKNSMLDMSGSGSLVAIGNNGTEYDANGYYSTSKDASYAETGASGIAGEGEIYIHDLTALDAYGYGVAGFGIGGASTKITIENTAIGYARGGFVNVDGNYYDAKYNKSEPEGGAAIGSLTNDATITLNKVTVKEAIGGSKAAGIGARFWTNVTVVITDSTINNVVGGASSAAIGGSRVSSDENAVNQYCKITITNSNITAIGGYYGAGIGSGYNTHCHKPSDPQFFTVTINIKGNSVIKAQGGKYAAGIGTGYHNGGLAGEIESTVTVTANSGDKLYKDAYTQAQDIGFGVIDPTRDGLKNQCYITYGNDVITVPEVGSGN